MSHSPDWPDHLVLLDDIDLSLGEQLALDDELLTAVDRAELRPLLRFWQSPTTAVVLGRGNVPDLEVDLPACRDLDVPIWRRSSGGGTVVVGPGCLAFTLVLPATSQLRNLGAGPVTRLLLERSLSGWGESLGLSVQGVSDITLGDRKISGNAQRWKRDAFLHHGTVLLSFDLDLVRRLLREPARRPEYRSTRSHSDFVQNAPFTADEFRKHLVEQWDATIQRSIPPEVLAAANQLAMERAEQSNWRIA
jgi:lipoate-protein ligase A